MPVLIATLEAEAGELLKSRSLGPEWTKYLNFVYMDDIYIDR